MVVRNCLVLAGQTLLGVGSEISGGVRNIYMHDCEAPNNVHRLFFIKTNHRRGAFVENVYMEKIKTGATLRVMEIDMNVLYQWRTLVPTYEERITRIENIHMIDIDCKSAKMIYDLKGDHKLPVKDIELRNIHVGVLVDSLKHVENVENIVAENITFDEQNADALKELDRFLKNK